MTLADKIIDLRRKSGWSQEELAHRLNVSRQSVSKWEGAQSVPEVEKLLQMSRLFGVSTDYLLKDELEHPEETGGPIPPPQPIPSHESSSDSRPIRRVSRELAEEYLDRRQRCAPRIALATFLCILSPIPLLLLIGMSQDARFAITEETAAGAGLCALLVLVAVAVALFLSCGEKEYAFLEKEPLEVPPEVQELVRRREAALRPRFERLTLLGTVLCILSAVPLFAAVCVKGADLLYLYAVCLLLLLVGLGCIGFVWAGVCRSALKKLLEEDEYSRPNKARFGLMQTVSVCYWLVVTAIYLYVTFVPPVALPPERSWVIWAVAGVLFGAVMTVMRLLSRKK